MNARISLAVLAAFALSDACRADELRLSSAVVGPVSVETAEGPWRTVARVEGCADGIDELSVSLAADTDRPPPAVTVSFGIPQNDIHHKWSTRQEATGLPPDWKSKTTSRLCAGLPLVSFLNANDRNRLLVAASEAKRTVVIESGLREENCRIVFKLRFFTEPEAPISAYAFKVRFDGRDVFFGDAISEGTRWMERTSGLVPAEPPAAAYEPLYSTWYSFHQDVHAADIEAECAEAAKLGMRTLIVDDGWQTDDTSRGYAHCGDWEVSTNRFPDMAAHVRRVQGLGLKYMVWYNVPFVGVHSRNYARFKGRYLWEVAGQYGCLDPRFPEVRDFLCGTYERAARDWGLDGFKLDFIDSFAFRGKDPAIAENYRGRDIKSLPEATDRLLGEAVRRIRTAKPEALIEFRQGYVGPAIRQYGNMLRAGDCPADLMLNRIRTANLRLTSGASAVHADMLEWHPDETPENAARFVLSTIFSTIQYSVMLRTLPSEHRRMVKHWLDFSKKHRHALLHGAFRPHHFGANYPWIEAEDADERIVGVYTAGTVADLGMVDRQVFVLNGTGTDRLTVRLGRPATVGVFDTFGLPIGTAQDLPRGIHDVSCPVSGYLFIRK